MQKWLKKNNKITSTFGYSHRHQHQQFSIVIYHFWLPKIGCSLRSWYYLSNQFYKLANLKHTKQVTKVLLFIIRRNETITFFKIQKVFLLIKTQKQCGDIIISFIYFSEFIHAADAGLKTVKNQFYFLPSFRFRNYLKWLIVLCFLININIYKKGRYISEGLKTNSVV